MMFENAFKEDGIEMAYHEIASGPEQTKEMFSWYDFSSAITAEDITALEATQDFLISNGLQEKSIHIEDIIIK